jgi:hypothetical protein
MSDFYDIGIVAQIIMSDIKIAMSGYDFKVLD